MGESGRRVVDLFRPSYIWNVSKYLGFVPPRSPERVGDHAVNTAEHVIYLVRGLDVRHAELDELILQIEESH